MTNEDASAAQIIAANPTASTWLSANAGSGKTRVLTDRVARLLLHDVEPQRILCLTYTKAAASEMQNRLFATLGAWAMMPDADLRDALAELGETGRLDLPHLASARRLFARAIETPGGLRIQTIHSFCAALLRRFPLEAGVSPQFTELDDRSARLLREEIAEEMSDHLAPDLMQRVALAFRGDAFNTLIEEISANRAGFAIPFDLATAFDMPRGESAARILGDTFLGGEVAWMPRLTELLGKGSPTDKTNAIALRTVAFSSPALSDLAELEDLFLYGKKAKSPFGAKIGAVPTKPTQKLLPDIMPDLNALMQRVEAARPRRLTLAAAQKTETLHLFAAAFLPIYAERKAVRGWLDFDDLISRAKALLTDPSVAAWVLYRLDSGIDHVLVDEAK